MGFQRKLAKAAVLLSCFLALAGCAKVSPAIMAERDKLQGTWKPVSAEIDGKPARPEVMMSLRFHFQGDKVNIQRESQKKGSVKANARYGLNLDRTPKEIDFGSNSPGIYAFDGDTLKLCFTAQGAVRPQEFSTQLRDGRTGPARTLG